MEAICPVVKAVGRLLWSGRQTKILWFTKILKFSNFNLKACFKLFEWIYGASSFIQIDIYGQYLKEMLL